MTMNPMLVVNTAKSFEVACADLRDAVVNHGFGVMAEHDLGESLRSKGASFSENCCVFEVCNPLQAAKVLGRDKSLSVALPCRISVYTDSGQTRFSMILPSQMLHALSTDSELLDIAQQVDVSTTAMIDEAAQCTESSCRSVAEVPVP